MELSAAPRSSQDLPRKGKVEGRPPSPRQQKPKGPLAAPFRCKICKEGFPTEKKMLIHKSVHFREVPFVCLNCFRTFDDFDVLQDHTASHRVFHCASCPSVFPDHLSLRKHLLMHPVGSIVS
ncbi:transcription factor che-1-like [Macrobrachium nipponense]|uniref:transcription factor che-1-like n=1 Tax=Macrobrachium nipponense TaxID=159736 RepID=UPI0030C7AE7C